MQSNYHWSTGQRKTLLEIISFTLIEKAFISSEQMTAALCESTALPSRFRVWYVYAKWTANTVTGCQKPNLIYFLWHSFLWQSFAINSFYITNKSYRSLHAWLADISVFSFIFCHHDDTVTVFINIMLITNKCNWSNDCG